jgi:hypothetical protein
MKGNVGKLTLMVALSLMTVLVFGVLQFATPNCLMFLPSKSGSKRQRLLLFFVTFSIFSTLMIVMRTLMIVLMVTVVYGIFQS